MKTLLFPFVAALALAACSPSKIEFQIDNPTDTPLALSIDGQDLPVAAHGSRPVSLAIGEHRLHTDTLGDVRFIVYVDGRGGLINPTLSEYVIAREVYVTDESKLKNFGTGKAGIELGGVDFEGPFEKSHELFIDKTWTYGVREPFPTERWWPTSTPAAARSWPRCSRHRISSPTSKKAWANPVHSSANSRPATWPRRSAWNRPRPACRHSTPPSRRTPRRCARSMPAG